MATSNVTTATLARMKGSGEKIAVLTCYDASFARVLEQAGVEVLLVGDSLGMVVQGQESTLPVTVDDMVYHARCVARVRKTALLVVDMPFMSYGTPAQALQTAGRLMQQGGAQMVKLEGGAVQVATVRYLTERGIPVCGHLGLLPQSVHRLGGYRVQGRDAGAAQQMQADALALQRAGADMLVLECVPAAVANAITASLEIPVIGIGAGAGCDGQVLVLYDVIGISGARAPRFANDFLQQAGSVSGSVASFVADVKAGRFPGPQHTYS